MKREKENEKKKLFRCFNIFKKERREKPNETNKNNLFNNRF